MNNIQQLERYDEHVHRFTYQTILKIYRPIRFTKDDLSISVTIGR